MNVVSVRAHGSVSVITIDNPPVNALSTAVIVGLADSLAKALSQASTSIVIACAGRTFVAGADISEFDAPVKPLPDVVGLLDGSTKPIVAAIHGTALGGGFELALACHYRIARADARVGLPEVSLGLIPGGGGTQRVPRLAGAKVALEMISAGAPISAPQAHEWGLVDRIATTDDLVAEAVNYAEELVRTGAPLRRARDLSVANVDANFWDSERRRLSKKSRGQIAPLAIVDCIEAAATLSFDEGIRIERERFETCVASPQSAALRHLFFAQRAAAKIKDIGPEVAPRPIKSAAVIGGGTMGRGITISLLDCGIPVTMLEVDGEALARAQAALAAHYESAVSRKRLSKSNADASLGRLSGATDYADLAQVDIVIEAVFEDLALKKTVFQRLDAVAKRGAILATNTSRLDVDAIAAATSRPADVVGVHFFSPANIMKLVEVVRGAASADDVIVTTMNLAKTMRKVPVLARVCDGFIGNRMLLGYVGEVQALLLEGASPELIDSVMEEWGMAMGPLAVSDLAGLDIGYQAASAAERTPVGKISEFQLAYWLVEHGRRGQKSGSGFYTYDPQTRARKPDPEAVRLIKEAAERLGVPQRQVDKSEVLERMVYPLINIGSQILEEGVAQRSSDIDVVYIFGYGFPGTRGGPMYFADHIGLKPCLAKLREFHERYGTEYWRPSPLLVRLAESGRTFASLETESI